MLQICSTVMLQCSTFFKHVDLILNDYNSLVLKNGEDGIRTRGPAFDRSRL